MLPGKTFSPTDILDIVRRRAWLLLVPPAVGVFVALLYSSTVPDRYQSDMLIAIVPRQVEDDIVRSTVAVTATEYLDSISVQVRSRLLLERLIEEFGLYPESRGTVPMERIVENMSANLAVALETPRSTPRGPEPPSAFHIRFTYHDPTVAARVTQRIGTLFVSQNARDRGALAEATTAFLDTQLAEARERLEAQERRLEAFRERNGQSLPTQMSTNLQAIQSTQLQIQSLVESIARDRDRKLLLERLYREASNEPAPVEAASAATPAGDLPPTASAAERLAAARTSLAALERRLESVHPDVIRGRRLVSELEAAAAAEKNAPAPTAVSPAEAQRRERLREMAAEIESLDRQMQFKESEEGRLRALAAGYQRRVEAVPSVESEWAVLNRDYETLQTAYRDLLNKREASQLATDLEQQRIGDQFRILDNASVPERPIGPFRLQISSAGLGIGLFFGLALAALVELRDSSFRSDKDVHDTLGLPVIAMVPYVQTARERARGVRKRMWVTAGTLTAVGGAGVVVWALQLWRHLI